jgi:succinoglycan biosynthesis protein ExoH
MLKPSNGEGSSTGDQEIFSRISILRFVMIFGIVILHTPPYVPIRDTGTEVFDFVKAFFQHGLFRTTVPMLTFISGFLLFRTGLDLHPSKLLKKKLKTLVIPFLVFNISVLVAAYIAEAAFGLKLSYDLLTADIRTWLDAAFGITASPINYPLNFIRDLVVIMVMAPVLGLLLRSAPLKGLVLVTLIFYLNLDGYLVLRPVMVVTFYLGGMAAIQGWNMRALDKYAVPLLILLVLCCAAIVRFEVANTTYLRLVAPLMIWPASALLVRTRFGLWLDRMSRYSFFVFIAHAPLLLVTWVLYQRTSQYVPYELYWMLAPIIITSVLVLIYMVLTRTFPTAFAVAIGQALGRSPARQASPIPSVASEPTRCPR